MFNPKMEGRVNLVFYAQSVTIISGRGSERERERERERAICA